MRVSDSLICIFCIWAISPEHLAGSLVTKKCVSCILKSLKQHTLRDVTEIGVLAVVICCVTKGSTPAVTRPPCVHCHDTIKCGLLITRVRRWRWRGVLKATSNIVWACVCPIRDTIKKGKKLKSFHLIKCVHWSNYGYCVAHNCHLFFF